MKIKKIIGVLLGISALVIMIVCVVDMIVFRFQNPDMTSIRCLLENTSLIPWEIGAVLGYIIGRVLVKR